MRIGLTYDLRDDYLAAGYSLEETAEFDRIDTIDAIEAALQAQGFEVERLGRLQAMVGALASGRRWDFVFNIAEGMYGLAREAQVPALLEAYGIPCTFSDATVMALALHKGLTKHVLRDGGVPTAPFQVVSRCADLDAIELPYPLFAKPVAEGTSKGIGADARVESADQLHRVVDRLLQQYRQPVLVETYLPGREFTVGLLGSGAEARAVGTIEILLGEQAEPGVYSFANKAHYEDRVRYELLEDPLLRHSVEAVALQAWAVLGGRDAGRVDVRLDAAGQPNCIEVNPLPGLNPQHSDLPILWRMQGGEFPALIGAIVEETLKRLPGIQPARARAAS